MSLMTPSTLHRGRTLRECPRCKGQYVLRSRSQTALGRRVLRLLGLRMYRCDDCWHRFIGAATRRTGQVAVGEAGAHPVSAGRVRPEPPETRPTAAPAGEAREQALPCCKS